MTVRAEGSLNILVKSDIQAGRLDSLYIDDRQKLVFINAKPLRLSSKEYALLDFLAVDPGRVYSSNDILKALWKGNHRASRNDVRQSIYLLRRRIEADPHNPKIVETVNGFGYRLVVQMIE